MDWGSVVPSVVTGIVGVAGIVGSYMSAKHAGKSATDNLRISIAAEDERARVAEKRRIYANFLTTLTEGMYAASIVRSRKDTATKEYHVAVEEANRARVAATNALSEVRLIGPIEVGSLGSNAVRALLRVLDAETPIGEFGKAHAQLTFAMRADLGEPVSQNGQTSDLESYGQGSPNSRLLHTTTVAGRLGSAN